MRAVLSMLAVTIAIGAGTAGGAAAQQGPVLVVGDSLEVGTGPHLRRELGSAPVTIDARTGRPSTEGVGVLSRALRPSHRVVVFDLGTNDDPAQTAGLRRSLAGARRLVGGRCLVVATLTRPPVNGISIDGPNRVVESFVASTPNAVLFDWHEATSRDPNLLRADGVHPSPAGYAKRARLLAGTITGCLDGTQPSARGSGKPSDRGSGEGSDRGSPSAAAPSRSRPSERRPSVRSEPAWAGLLRVLPYAPIAAYVRSGMARATAAARGVLAGFGPPPPEPKLGEPGSSARRR